MPAASHEANLELARDLASLCVDGGVLLVGIKDDKGRAGEVVGTTQPGPADRITAVALSNISPPLQVSIDTFHRPGSADGDVLAVRVPMSPAAPHMVDGSYWGRNNSGKYALPDSDVRRIMAERTISTEGFDETLRELANAFDPMPSGDRSESHLYLLAKPLSRHVPVALTDADASLTPEALLKPPAVATTTLAAALSSARQQIPHPDGPCFGIYPASQPPPREHQLLRVLMKDDGTVQLVSGAGTVTYSGSSSAPVRVIPTRYILEITHSFVRLVSHLSEKYLSYLGDWLIGLHIERCYNALPAEAYDVWELDHLIGYPTADYAATTTATAIQLSDAPLEVTRKLARGLLRGLGLEEFYADYASLGAHS